MSELKTNKFKVGDKVEVVSVNSTVAEYGGADYLVPIGTIDNISWMNGDGLMIELESSDYIYSPKDLRLIADEEIGLLNGSVPEKDNVKGIPSDGGSSDYYFTKLPQHLIDQIVETGGIEIKDIIRYVFDNNADAFNIVKAQKRIVEANKGKGKLGITALYDANKIKFFANEQYEAIKQGEVE